MAPKRSEPVVTTTDIADLVERDMLAEQAAGVAVAKFAMRLVNDGTGRDYAHEVQMDLVIDGLNGLDTSDVGLALAFFDDEDVLLDTSEMTPADSYAYGFTRATSRNGHRLHVKYRGGGKEVSRLARCQLTITRAQHASPSLDEGGAAWEPDETALDVQFDVDPRLPVEVELDRAIVRSGYNDGYVVTLRALVSPAGSSQLSALDRLLTRETLARALTIDGFLRDEAGGLADTFTEHVEAGRTMPFVLHVRHHVNLDVPLATQAVVTVRKTPR